VIGEQIGNFEIVSQLGRGGMGEVYLGVHEKIGTKVAVKMLLPHISINKGQVERFFNEAIAVGKIQHSGIGKIFDVGFQGTRAYLVMEFLDGETLAARIRRLGKLPLSQISDIGKQISGVLEAVHKAGITHRDLKPDNIFLVPDDELASGERVKILDFGIAKLSDNVTGGLTATGVGSMGTPGYMSPEQWKNSKAVDWRADAYSLGCLTFEMTAGRIPFLAQTIGEACSMHLTEEPPRLGALVAVPAALDTLVAQLLSKVPDQRPASMRDIANVFGSLAASGPATALGATTPPLRPVTPFMVTQETNAPLVPDVQMPTAPIGNWQPRASQVPSIPQPLQTTLGGANAEMAVVKPRGNRALIFALLGAVAVLAVVVVVLVARGGSTSQPETSIQPAVERPAVAAVMPAGSGSSVASSAASPSPSSTATTATPTAGSSAGSGSGSATVAAVGSGSATLPAPIKRPARKIEGRPGPIVATKPEVDREPTTDADLPKHTPVTRPIVRTLYPQLDRCAATHGGVGTIIQWRLEVAPSGRMTNITITGTANTALVNCVTAVFAKPDYGRSQQGTRALDAYRLH
jgi:serine/threonine-protein kinase